jgi:SAM-dependent methyltransferase
MNKNSFHWFQRGGLFHPTKNYSHICQQFNNPAYNNKKIINIGSGGYAPIKNAINIDPYRKGPNIIAAFGENLPFENESIDVVVCVAVLEHVKEPEKIISEAWRVLKKNGEIYLEVPFLQPFHPTPGDYQRWTINGLRFLCKNFKEKKSGIGCGPGSAVTWIIVEYVQTFTTNKFANSLLKNIAKIILFPLKYLDRFLIKKEKSNNVASSFYFLGEK